MKLNDRIVAMHDAGVPEEKIIDYIMDMKKKADEKIVSPDANSSLISPADERRHMYETTLIQTNPHCISVKVLEDVVRHDFDITDGRVEYTIVKQSNEPVAKAYAELVNLQPDGYGIKSLIIRTELYYFEVVHGENSRYFAYRSIRH